MPPSSFYKRILAHAARTRDRQAAPEDEAEESDATEEACSMVLRCTRPSFAVFGCVRPYAVFVAPRT